MNDVPLLPPVDADPELQPCPPEVIPNVENLVIEDGAPVDSFLAEKLMRLLTEPLYSSWKPGKPFLAAADAGLFITPKEPPLVPDVMLSLDVQAGDFSTRENLSYFVWIIGKLPEVVIEVVSNREGGEADRKLHAYERMGILCYVIYDPQMYLSGESLRVFVLQHGQYERFASHWLPRVGLGLKIWEGRFEDKEGSWLRWCDQQGSVIPTGVERAERLASLLRQHGIDPDKA